MFLRKRVLSQEWSSSYCKDFVRATYQKLIETLNEVGITDLTMFGDISSNTGINFEATSGNFIPQWIRDAKTYNLWAKTDSSNSYWTSSYYGNSSSDVKTIGGHTWRVRDVDYFALLMYNRDGYWGIMIGYSLLRKYNMDKPEITTAKKNYVWAQSIIAYSSYESPFVNKESIDVIVKYDEDDFLFGLINPAYQNKSRINYSPQLIGQLKVIPVFSTTDNYYVNIPSVIPSQFPSSQIQSTAKFAIANEKQIFGHATYNSLIDKINGDKLPVFKFWLTALDYGVLGQIKNIITIYNNIDYNEYNIGGMMYLGRCFNGGGHIQQELSFNNSNYGYLDANSLLKG